MNEEKDPKIIINLKTWFKKTSKITISFLMISFILGSTGLILGATAHHKTNELKYFLNNDHTAVWGNTTIWQENVGGDYKIRLYFNTKPEKKYDIVWNGTYPQGYFWN